jgi:hypothetical protein
MIERADGASSQRNHRIEYAVDALIYLAYQSAMSRCLI